jgi:diguanylate cyclase (GGDEF)-like protein
VIILTANNASSDLVTALDAGADDYVGKPFDADELRVRLRAGQRIVELQGDLLRKASHDDLTGVFNRRMSSELLRREHARAQRDQRPLSVAMLDIDHFKRVNDEHGHQVGDAVLEEVARRITASLRTNDAVGRYGGEEFLLIMPDCDAPSARSIAERVRAAIAATAIPGLDRLVQTTVSIGVATGAPPCLPPFETLTRDADAALYDAKRRGRNRVETSAGRPGFFGAIA